MAKGLAPPPAVFATRPLRMRSLLNTPCVSLALVTRARLLLGEEPEPRLAKEEPDCLRVHVVRALGRRCHRGEDRRDGDARLNSADAPDRGRQLPQQEDKHREALPVKHELLVRRRVAQHLHTRTHRQQAQAQACRREGTARESEA
eukprot:5952396-Pleurochrysis_carterae.AAC.1